MPGFPWTACSTAERDRRAWPERGCLPNAGEHRLRHSALCGLSRPRPGLRGGPQGPACPTLMRNGPALACQVFVSSSRGACTEERLADTARWLVPPATPGPPSRARCHNARWVASLGRACRAGACMTKRDSPVLTRATRTSTVTRLQQLSPNGATSGTVSGSPDSLVSSTRVSGLTRMGVPSCVSHLSSWLGQDATARLHRRSGPGRAVRV